MNKLITKLSKMLAFVIFMFCGILLSSCCSPKPVEINVKFLNADSRLGLSDYSYLLDYNDNTKISFDIPKGYDHTQVIGTIEGKNIEYSTTFASNQKVDNGYEYNNDKTITFALNNVKRGFTLEIDLKDMPKKTFSFKLEEEMTDFQILVVPEEITKNYLVELLNSDVIETIDFVSNYARVEYGKYVILMHNKVQAKTDYNILYSNLNHFTSATNKSSIGTIEFSKYPKAKKGNTDYVLNNDTNTALYYIGEVKEDINFYSEIPEYEPDKGFDITIIPNIFHLFTNMQKYNSDMLTVETFTTTNETFDISNENYDKVGETTIKKIDASQTYKNRYDMHKLYLGDYLSTDQLISTKDKENLYNDIYFVISSDRMELKNLNFYLLKDEYEQTKTAQKLTLSESATVKGKYYIRLSKDDLQNFVLNRDYVNSTGGILSYKTGQAIFYTEVDYSFFNLAKMGTYMRIFKNINIVNNDAQITGKDIVLDIYTIVDGERRYGLVDNHFWPNSALKRDCEYFVTSDFFDDKNYKNNLYLEIFADSYKNFRSVRIENIVIKTATEILTRTPLQVEDARVYNGINDYLIESFVYNDLGEYTITIDVTLEPTLKEQVALDFSNLSLGVSSMDGVYITQNSNFKVLSDFTFVGNSNKNIYNQAKFSLSTDLYYFVKSNDVNFDIEVRLDPNDPDSCISSSQEFCDILGRPITMSVNGEPYKIKVLKQSVYYEFITQNKMYVVKK